MADTKIFLSESEMPQAWYNIQPDLPHRSCPRSIRLPVNH